MPGFSTEGRKNLGVTHVESMNWTVTQPLMVGIVDIFVANV
jgi:hypothetical protein